MKKWLTLVIACGLALGATNAVAQDMIPNDIDVTFTVCVEGTGTTGDVCVTGDNNELTNWGNGVVMLDQGSDIWEVTITFPAGTLAEVKYKYRNNGCADWEDGGDRVVNLPIDGTTAVALQADSFNRLEPIGCGFSEPLEFDVTICFQLCMEGVASTGGQCVIGSRPEMGEWDPESGLSMRGIGADLYQRCLTFQAGEMVPLTVEYKYQKDLCATWEQLPGGDPFANRTFTIDNDTDPNVRLTSTWEDGEGQCATVATETTSWSTLKASF